MTQTLTPSETRLVTEPFDFQKAGFNETSARPLSFISIGVPERVDAGISIIDYPFRESWPALAKTTDHPEIALRVKANTDQLLEAIERHANQVGVEFTATWAFDELLTNATQYGELLSDPRRCGLVRVEWAFVQDNDRICLELAISNPARTLFDPSKYLMMNTMEFIDLPREGSNAHIGTTTLLGKLENYPELKYAWHLPDGDKIIFSMERMSEQEISGKPELEDILMPVRRNVLRVNSEHEVVPYSLDQFMADINLLPAESVTVALRI